LTSRVTFAGAIPHAQVPGYLALADFYVTASVSEVHPLTVIEALAASLPVVGIQSPGLSDTVLDGGCGLLTCHHIESFSRAICRMATDDGLRERLAGEAQTRSLRYGIARTTEAMLALYEGLLGAAPHRQPASADVRDGQAMDTRVEG
jgi:glycosyltransferase involved in cell wall biosynthesis